MSSSCTSKVVLAGALVAIGAATAHADPTTLLDRSYLEITAENKTADLELGFSMPVGSKLHLRPYVRVPFADADEHLIRIDKYSRAIKLGGGVDYDIDDTQEAGPSKFLRLSLEAELGTKKHGFTPLGTTSASDAQHQSFSASLQALYGYLLAEPGGGSTQLAPQLAVSYNRSYQAADAIGVVVPGQNALPDTVDMVVVDAPSVAPSLTVRLGSPLYDGSSKAPIAFGAYGTATLTGKGYAPWGEGELVRAELWTYLFLPAPNTRAGVAMFIESSRARADVDRATGFGLFAQLKANVTMFDY
jgi:hypothetical protein